jgi:hypothetical protein
MQNTTSTANPWAAATPLLNNLISGYTGVNTAVTPAQQAAGQGLQTAAAGVPNLTPQATQAVQNIFGNAGLLNSAYGQTQSALSPIANASLDPYKTPGFSDALANMNQQALNTVKGMYAQSGRDPSGAANFGQTFARQVLPSEAAAISGQYNQNVGNVANAANILQNAGINTTGAMSGQTMQALQGAGLLPSLQMAPATAQLQAANVVQGQPAANLQQILAPAMGLGGMGGTTTSQGYGTGTQTPANNPLMNILGGAAMVGGLISDKRLKTNIKDIGRTHDNQKIYSYHFKAGGPPQIGMMADEIQKKAPEAVVRGPDGFKRVNYDLATRKAARMGMLKAA